MYNYINYNLPFLNLMYDDEFLHFLLVLLAVQIKMLVLVQNSPDIAVKKILYDVPVHNKKYTIFQRSQIDQVVLFFK